MLRHLLHRVGKRFGILPGLPGKPSPLIKRHADPASAATDTPVHAEVMAVDPSDAGRASLPEDFDWAYYLQQHEDLRRSGLCTEADAVRHYLDHGQREQRAYR